MTARVRDARGDPLVVPTSRQSLAILLGIDKFMSECRALTSLSATASPRCHLRWRASRRRQAARAMAHPMPSAGDGGRAGVTPAFLGRCGAEPGLVGTRPKKVALPTLHPQLPPAGAARNCFCVPRQVPVVAVATLCATFRQDHELAVTVRQLAEEVKQVLVVECRRARRGP